MRSTAFVASCPTVSGFRAQYSQTIPRVPFRTKLAPSAVCCMGRPAMARACIGVAACMLCARAALGLESASDYIFADGFEFPYLSPVWLPGVCDVQAATGAFVSDSAVVLNTDIDGNCTGGVVAQTNGPDICVVRADTIAIS